jgi:integrase
LNRLNNVVEMRPEDRTDGGRKAPPERRRRSFGKIAKLRSGRFQASYTIDGVRHVAPVTFPTRTDAAAWLAMTQGQRIEHRWKPAPPPEPLTVTFGAFAEAWLENNHDLAPRTRSEYRKLLDRLLVTFGEVRLVELSGDIVADWWDALDPDKPSAREHLYGLLHAIVASAADPDESRRVLRRAGVDIGLVPMGYAVLPTNPVRRPEKKARRGRPATQRRARVLRPATGEELELIRARLPERYRVMLDVAAWMALRFGELTELRRRDLDLERGILRVERAVTWTTASTPTVGPPKSDAGVRTLFIPNTLIPRLREHLDKFANPGDDALVFSNTQGHHMHHGSLYKVFRPARKSAGRPDLRWHDLRHTGATNAAPYATTRELMTFMGHSTMSAALIYQHAVEDRMAGLSAAMNTQIPRLPSDER